MHHSKTRLLRICKIGGLPLKFCAFYCDFKMLKILLLKLKKKIEKTYRKISIILIDPKQPQTITSKKLFILNGKKMRFNL